MGQTEVQEETPGTTNGQWRCVIAWYDGTNAYIQMDNGPVYSTPAPPPTPTSNPIVVLKRDRAAGGFAADEIFLFKRTLSSLERKIIFERRFSLTNTPDLYFNLTISATVPTAPRFLTNPLDTTRWVGESVTLAPLAASIFPIHYQWLFNGLAIPGATNCVLHLPYLDIANSGFYSLIASNLAGAVTSAPAKLTVVPRPYLTVELASDSTTPVLKFSGAHTKLQLLSSTNLKDWTVLYEIPPTTNVLQIPCPMTSTFPYVFYRLRAATP